MLGDGKDQSVSFSFSFYVKGILILRDRSQSLHIYVARYT